MCQVCIRCSLFQNPTVRHHSGTEGNNWGLNSLVQVWARGKLPFGCAGTTAISAAARPLLWLGLAYCSPKIQKWLWWKKQSQGSRNTISCTFHVFMYNHCYVMCVSISNKKGWNYLGYICLDCKASVWKTRTSSDKFKKLPHFTVFIRDSTQSGLSWPTLLAAGPTCD